ncbi:MAG TPA: peroxide stress protein YaaA [Haloplasmataceae bacterium]
MRIIISPAKKINVDTNSLDYYQLPHFIKDTEILLDYIKSLSYDKLKSIWNCSDKIALYNYKLIKSMDLYHNLTPAILAFEGIQYQYMGQKVFTSKEFAYLEEHLRIISGFYGILRPFDGITPYRLEMQAKLGGIIDSLYEFWNRKIFDFLFSETNCIINLASKEYSKCISNYLDDDKNFITCIFGELHNDKIVEKGTLVKMARGEMVRFMAKNQIKNIDDIKCFNSLNYKYIEELSNQNNLVFINQVVYEK